MGSVLFGVLMAFIAVVAVRTIKFKPKPQPAPEAPRKKAAPIRVEAPEMVIHSGYNDLKKKTKPQPLTGKAFFANPWVRTFIAAALILLVFIGIFNGVINMLLAPRSKVPQSKKKTEDAK